MSNFRFLQAEWPELAERASEAERHVFTAPSTAGAMARIALEATVAWLYANDSDLQTPYQDTLNERMNERSFKENLPQSIYREIHYVRKEGNNAIHGKRINEHTALAAIKYLHHFHGWFARLYGEGQVEVPAFDEGLLPRKGNGRKTLLELQQLQERFEDQRRALEQAEQRRQELETERAALEQRLAAVQARKDRNQSLPIPAGPYTEAETRRHFIDAMLREAGWDPDAPNATEYEVSGMPTSVNATGKGYVDYVLWGADGRPVGLVEAKHTLVNAERGQTQAGLYADCLERMHGQRPVIYYTNGFDIWLWDDSFHTPREVLGFHTQEELQLMVDRRSTRLDPRAVAVDPEIAGRYYQKEAIARVAEAFAGTHNGELRGLRRRALLVMATGAGKTRTAAALVDVFMRANWAKRVLFLADRNALVTQAKRAFEKHLPNVTTIDLTKQRDDGTTRVVFSTYPTIMNRIDASMAGDARHFGIGHFDLVIVDEAHRSVYQRYKAIFNYFDSLLLGLTATPHAEGDRDTYLLFDCPEHNPTHFYELDQAVRDGFLVPPVGRAVDMGFMTRGIKYDELGASDKEQYERTFRDDDGNMPAEIDAGAIDRWLFNDNTIDQVLGYLMANGIKVEGGDKLGKTIVFARSIDHALAIQRRFNKQFPHLGGHFLRVVHSKDPYAQDIIDKFEAPDLMPQIAVSVDMLDTGIDVEEIVNLVFFKPVYSKAKFWQMIGRGTRLCPDLFGPGEDKKEFRIFDFCGNYAFFDVTPEGRRFVEQRSLSHRIYEATIRLSEALRDPAYQDEIHQRLRSELLDRAHAWTEALWERRNTVLVRAVKRYVDRYRERAAWDALTDVAVSELFLHVAPLVDVEDADEMAKRFDLLILHLQGAVAEAGPDQNRLFLRLGGVANNLLRIGNIPAVAEHLTSIRAITNAVVDQNLRTTALDLPALGRIREQLRSLVRLIPTTERPIVFTDLRDSIVAEGADRRDIPGSYEMRGYRIKVERFIRENAHHLTIHRLHTNQPITAAELEELERLLFDGDERGTKEKLMEELEDDRPLGFFIRSILGLDEHAAKEAFGEFLTRTDLRADQIRFIDQLISYLSINGIIDKAMLSGPPFTDLNDQGIFGLFDDAEQDRLLSIMDGVNGNAVA